MAFKSLNEKKKVQDHITWVQYLTLLGSYRTVAYRDVEEKLSTKFQMEFQIVPYGNVTVRNILELSSTVLIIGTEIGTMMNVVTRIGNEIGIGIMLLEVETWFRILSTNTRSRGMN